MAALDIRSIKNISGSPVVINGNPISAGETAYAFYKPAYFSNNAGGLQQAITQGFVECYGTDGSLLSTSDAFVASSRAADYLSNFGDASGKMLEVTIDSSVTLGLHEQLVIADTSAEDLSVTLPPSDVLSVGKPIELYNIGTGVLTIYPEPGQTIRGATGIEIPSLGYTRLVASGEDVGSWGILSGAGDTGSPSGGTQGATGVQGIQGVTGPAGGGGSGDGATGLQGVTGAQGDTGIQGLTGLMGATGLEGSAGATGLPGETGAPGQQGTTGVDGAIGATGLNGVAGVDGVTGIQGPTGAQGETGLSGVTGLEGTQGTTGLVGETGSAGVAGADGATGAMGPTGANGETGLPGSQGETGIQGATGAASSVIGPAEDGDYTDGLFVDFVVTTPIGTAVDRFNEVLKSLAPTPAPVLTNISISNTGVAGKLSFGSSNPISGYTNVPTKDINATLGTAESITDGSDTVVMRGIFNATTAMSGNLADTVVAGPGTPTPSYPAKAFGDGDSGFVELWLNGVKVAEVNLASTTNAITDSNANAVLSVTASTAAKFPNGTDFPVFKYRTGTWQVLAAGQRSGYNRVEVRRVNGTTVVTNIYGWVVDAATTATTFASESLSGLTMTGSKYLSGVNYHTAGTATYAITASNVHRNTYSSSGSAITHTGTRCSVPSSSLGNIALETDTEPLSKTATVATGSRILNQGISASTTVDRTVQGDLTSTGVSAYSLLLDATATSGTATLENMDDEVYRVASNLVITTTSGYNSSGSSPADWDSTISLVSATAGYSDGLLVHNGVLQYPTRGTNSGNFSGVANGPAGNVDYSAATGNRVFLRYFYDASPRQNFRLAATVISTSFVSVATGPSGNNLTLEVLAPNTTSDGSSTVWKDAVVPYTNDNSVGCYASAFGSTIPTTWGMTLGGKNTSTSGYVIVLRVTASSAWTGSINTLQLTWL